MADNVHTRVGKYKVGVAHGGKDQFGLKLSIADRKKLLESAAEDLVRGMKKDADKKAGITRRSNKVKRK